MPFRAVEERVTCSQSGERVATLSVLNCGCFGGLTLRSNKDHDLVASGSAS